MGAFWTDDDRKMAVAMLGPEAFDYLNARHDDASPDGHLIAVGGGNVDLQNKLQDLVEGPGSLWAYAILWQISRSMSEELVLGWGDGHCRELRDGEEESSGFRSHLFDGVHQKKMRKRLLERLHALSGGLDDENYATRLDRITDAEMYFLASMYFSFPKGEDASGRAFASGKHIWISEAELTLPASSSYCVRAYLARSAGFRTFVFVPIDAGVLELGSMNTLPESFEVLQMIRSVFSQGHAKVAADVGKKTDENVSPVSASRFSARDQVDEFPKIIFENDLISDRVHVNERPSIEKMEQMQRI